MADTEARWYCVNAQGLPMLCASKEDAEREAARNDKVWPKGAPHRAVQLCDAAERDSLRAQVEDMRAAVHSCHPGCSNARCVAERLRADVAELRKDAERYRWLRDNGTSEWGICVWGDDEQEWAQDMRAADVVDRAIDAAMELHNAKFSGGR